MLLVYYKRLYKHRIVKTERPTRDIVVIIEAGGVEDACLCLVTLWAPPVVHRGAHHVSRPHSHYAFITRLQKHTNYISQHHTHVIKKKPLIAHV